MAGRRSYGAPVKAEHSRFGSTACESVRELGDGRPVQRFSRLAEQGKRP
jgi:hypothetical protein